MEWKRLTAPLLAAALCFTLSGCFFRPVDQLYAVPQPPKDYEALQQRLSEVVDLGGEYAAPLGGEMIQSVQLQDLDGDGSQEAIAFFRISGEEKPLKIYIFRQIGQSYETFTVIEGAGTAINAVDYVQLDDSPYKEIVVSWQMTAQVHSLAAYAIGYERVEELLRTDYDGYQLYDMDRDNQQELMVFRTPLGGTPVAEYYDFREVLTMAGTAPISAGGYIGPDGAIKKDYLTQLRTGNLAEQVPAIFVSCPYGENGSITDIFVVRDGVPRNVTLDEETGESGETIRYYTQVYPRDINGDGIMEIPQPVPVIDYRAAVDSVSYWLVHWRQFSMDGKVRTIFSTYHNDRDGWYFILDDAWINNLTLSRTELAGGSERGVTFSWWSGEEWEEPKPFLTIYKLIGSSRESRARIGERFVIYPLNSAADAVETTGGTIYAAEFQAGWDCGLTQDEVRERFDIIRTDWYSGY